MRTRLSHRAYWACQAAGWGLYGLINVALLAGSGGASPALLLFGLAMPVMGLALSHALRARAGAGRWSELPLRRLAVRVLGAALLLGLVANTLGVGISVGVLRLRKLEELPLASFFVYLFNWSAVFLGWQLLYFGLSALQRSRRAELEKWQLAAMVQEAALGALKAQLNPHFLFNCLNSLRALIAEDPERAQALITRLASLLRANLDTRGARDTVPLSRELEVVQDYLALEAVRLEERLRVRVEVPPECLPVPVPGMLIQALVENGIKHGVARRPDGGEIVVTARLTDAALLLSVQNSAVQTPSSAAPPVGTGVGLRNASERLRLLFGDGADLSLDTSASAVTIARVRIPLPS